MLRNKFTLWNITQQYESKYLRCFWCFVLNDTCNPCLIINNSLEYKDVYLHMIQFCLLHVRIVHMNGFITNKDRMFRTRLPVH